MPVRSNCSRPCDPGKKGRQNPWPWDCECDLAFKHAYCFCAMGLNSFPSFIKQPILLLQLHGTRCCLLNFTGISKLLACTTLAYKHTQKKNKLTIKNGVHSWKLVWARCWNAGHCQCWFVSVQFTIAMKKTPWSNLTCERQCLFHLTSPRSHFISE